MAHLVCAGKYEEALQEGEKALDIAQNEIHPHLAMAEAHLAMGNIDDAVASAEQSASQSPTAIDGHRVSCGHCWCGAETRIGQRRSLREMGDTPTPLWGRAWYHLLCSELAEAARWCTRR